MSEQKTHRERKTPRISARDLADYMAASEIASRTIVQKAKYQPIGRVIQHNEARSTVTKFIRDNETDASWLREEAARLRDRLADSDFDRDLYDHNADYIGRVADVWGAVVFPSAQRSAPGRSHSIDLNGVHVTVDLHVALSRTIARTNKVRVGGIMLRYAKGKPLSPEVGAYQSAFLFGYLRRTVVDSNVAPDLKLCVTFDAQAGLCYSAPTNAISRFANMEAACATIAERWPNIRKPTGAIL